MKRITFIAFIASLALGCAPVLEPACTPGESRSCACPTGASGAQVCEDDGSALGPCECAEDGDAGGPDLDAGMLDAGAIEDPDAGEPAPLDAGTDAGPVDAGPPWGECWLAPQAGCEAGEACRNGRWPESPQSSPPSGPPECVPAGALGEFEKVDGSCRRDGVDLCQPGMFCSGYGCRRYCDPSAPINDECPPIPGTSQRECVPFYFDARDVLAYHFCQ